MLTTDDMGLVVWDNLADDYDHTALGANWQKIDDHDHTPGKGKQIPSGGLADSSITNVKLASDAVTTDKILDHTIQAVDLADGIIGPSQLDTNFIEKLVPLGLVTPWFRPTTSVAVPEGWHIADGSTLLAADHGWGGGSVVIPDLRNRFVLGASTTGVSNPTVSQTPAENFVGGNHSHTWNHTHTVPSHSHTISTAGSHSHYFGNDAGTLDPPTPPTGTGPEFSNANRGFSNVQTGGSPYLEPFAFKAHTHYGTTGSNGNHDHGGNTSSTNLTIDGTTVGGDIRPGYVGLLYIVKVKHPS